MESLLKKSLWSVTAILVAAVALSGALDATSEAYANQSFKRALLTFAAARALNSAISVAQGTEIAVEPGGVGVIVAIGQALDPINDLVEQFSTVMLVATTSLGLQNVLLDITAWWGITSFLVAAACAVIVCTWITSPGIQHFAPLLRRTLLVAIFVRFAVPVLTIGTTWVFDNFLAAEQAAATAALQATTQEIESINTEPELPARADQSLLDRLDLAFDQAMQSLQIGDRLEQLQQALSNASEHIINLIVIFLLQTIVLPILFVWAIAEFLKALGARALGK